MPERDEINKLLKHLTGDAELTTEALLDLDFDPDGISATEVFRAAGAGWAGLVAGREPGRTAAYSDAPPE